MSAKVHVGVPFAAAVACGAAGYNATGMYREHITCAACKRTDLYKALRNLPSRHRKTKREARK